MGVSPDGHRGSLRSTARYSLGPTGYPQPKADATVAHRLHAKRFPNIYT
ncbi:MAG: hypothetical protein AAF798_20310 [Bacteroidota bacterium]